MGPLRTVEALDRDALDAAVAAAKAPVFVLFTGAYTAGVSWCGDCNATKPALTAALARAAAAADGGITVIEVPLQREGYRGNPGHWARKHPAFALTAVPTLYRMGKTKAVASLVEGDVGNDEMLDELLGQA